ncbi:MAG: hypothetical protein JXR49_20825 [Acidobacteria bacterium]|nr:hypothetical protein [Acidobacteriota bacterium]
MGNVDYMIVCYLCGIMAVLALIILVGAGRQHKKTQKLQKGSPPERKD